MYVYTLYCLNCFEYKSIFRQQEDYIATSGLLGGIEVSNISQALLSYNLHPWFSLDLGNSKAIALILGLKGQLQWKFYFYL